jgi:hypothetical protein
MMRSARAWKAGLTALLLVGLGTCVVAQIAVSEFEHALRAIPVSEINRYVAAVELVLSQPDFPAVEVLQLIERLAMTPYSAQEKEALLFDMVVAMEDGLPVDGLVTKGLEGLARGVPVPQIKQSLHQRLILLAETRDLLYAKGIFSVAPGSPQSVPTALPTPRFNLLVTHISDTLADYLEGGGSPFEGQTLYQEVRFRLTSLEGVTLNAEDVDLVLKRIEPADMTRVALSAVT